MEIMATGSGFFHPYARSISRQPAASPQPAVAGKPDKARPAAVPSETPPQSPPGGIPTSGGFVNPQARQARQ
jgi:hypothetical protein